MPIKHAIWKVGSQPSPLSTTTLLSEQQLEDMIIVAPQILSSEWMLIGRQEQTGLGGRIDLLAIAPDASLVLIETAQRAIEATGTQLVVPSDEDDGLGAVRVGLTSEG